ncbi:MAG: polyprenyl synthetase family protein [Verrucomicrobia bacterium]|nr:polyprenyl synthetase family protein [Verrucomicrobiota bacterium]
MTWNRLLVDVVRVDCEELTRSGCHGPVDLKQSDRDRLATCPRCRTCLGVAFQIIDDILDCTATTEQLGKTAGKDAKTNKAADPSLLGLEKSRASEKPARRCARWRIIC